MYYLDVVDQFDVIEGVDVNHNGFEVVVHGTKDNNYLRHSEKFTSNKTGRAFGKRVSDFIGVKRKNRNAV